MLASKTQYCRAGYVWVMDVPRKQAAESLRILPRASAAALVNEKPDAVYIRKNALMGDQVLWLGGALLQMAVNQLSDLLAVLFRTAVAQFFFKGLAQRVDIAIFTKHQRNHEPVVARANLAIFTVIATESALLPARDIRGRPVKMGVSAREVRCVVLHIPRAQQAAARDRLTHASYNATVHDDFRANRQIFDRELLLGRNVGQRNIGCARERYGFAALQRCEGNQDVIKRIDFE